MTGVTRLSARLRRLPLVVWVAALLVVLIGLTGALGGFAAAPDRGRPVAAGEEILLQRWRVHVDDAVLIDESLQGQPPDPKIRVSVRLEFVGRETECCLSTGMLEVRFGGSTARTPTQVYAEPRSLLGFDPDVPTTRRLDFELEPPDLPAVVPDRVQVVVRDERPSSSPIWTEWVSSHAAASVDLPCPDLRRRR